MSQKIYVGNLPYSVNDAELQQNFSEFGDVISASVLMDGDSGRSKGFGFVEMGTAAQAEAAIQSLNGRQVAGRAIVVNLARPREQSAGYRSGARY